MDREELAISPIEHVGITVAVEMGQSRMALAVDGRVEQNILVDPIVVPSIMRRHLKRPGRDARIGMARDDTHRPSVIARPLVWVPGSRIAGAVINQIKLWIVGIPSPRCAAAQFPLVVAPRT